VYYNNFYGSNQITGFLESTNQIHGFRKPALMVLLFVLPTSLPRYCPRYCPLLPLLAFFFLPASFDYPFLRFTSL